MTGPKPQLVNQAAQMGPLADRLTQARMLAVDLESNGLFAFTARLCTLQILDVDAPDQVIVVDPLELADEALAPLSRFLGPSGPRKLIHDIAFDARIMAQHGLTLGNVFDTALAARFLGVQATGLGSLAEARLGLKLSKKMQHHDWGRRPLNAEALEYLANDVQVLPPLAAQLQAEVAAKALESELEEETNFRLKTAREDVAEPDPRPAYVRVRDAEKLAPAELAVLREVAAVREDEARRLGVPPFKVLDNAALIAISKSPPGSLGALANVRGLQHPRARALHAQLWAAVERGRAQPDVPAEERARFLTSPPRPPRAIATAMKQREQRLMAWRKEEAKRRGVDEQAILPGHVLRRLAERGPDMLESLADVPGLGRFRAERHGAELTKLIKGEP